MSRTAKTLMVAASVLVAGVVWVIGLAYFIRWQFEFYLPDGFIDTVYYFCCGQSGTRTVTD